MAFWDAKNGIVLGDPVDGQVPGPHHERRRPDVVRPVKGEVMPPALEGEGAFAASGTCLFALKGGNDAWFVTGGAKVSRVFHTADRGKTWTVAEAPVRAANASSGLFSIAFLDGRRGVVTGGDYKQPAFEGLNGARTEDAGATWQPAPLSKTGFFSAVAVVPGAGERLVAVGLAGTAESRDAGKTWKLLDSTPYNAVAFGADGAGWAIGPEGRHRKVPERATGYFQSPVELKRSPVFRPGVVGGMDQVAALLRSRLLPDFAAQELDFGAVPWPRAPG